MTTGPDRTVPLTREYLERLADELGVPIVDLWPALERAGANPSEGGQADDEHE